MNTRRVGTILGSLIFVIASCTSAPGTPEGGTTMSITLTSSAFDEGSTIPEKFTCEGPDVSPPLSWSGVPGDTQSLALIADDPDAPGQTWVHWVLFNISPEKDGLEEGASDVGTEGMNDFKRSGYGGPCPPPGNPHRYFFKLYALDTELDLPADATKVDVVRAMEGHILAQGQLMGTYSR